MTAIIAMCLLCLLFSAIEMLIDLLKSSHDLTLRQAAKALANLGVNPDNKRLIAQSEGIPALIGLLGHAILPVKIEVVAALANLAVNGTNYPKQYHNDFPFSCSFKTKNMV
jgi:hypothetical protein